MCVRVRMCERTVYTNVRAICCAQVFGQVLWIQLALLVIAFFLLLQALWCCCTFSGDLLLLPQIPYSALGEGAPESSSAGAGRDLSGECLRDVLGRGPSRLFASRLAEVEPCFLHGKRRAAHFVRASSAGFGSTPSRSPYADRSTQCFIIRRLG